MMFGLNGDEQGTSALRKAVAVSGQGEGGA
jgi:hypothetical protein